MPPPSPPLPLPILGCSSPPNSHNQNKVIPRCTGIEMLFSLQILSSFWCLIVVRFEWNIVLSNSYDIRKAWIHHVTSLRRYFYSPKLRLILSKAGVNSGDLLWVSSFKSWSCLKLNLQNVSATLTKGFVKCNVDLFSVHKCIT